MPATSPGASIQYASPVMTPSGLLTLVTVLLLLSVPVLITLFCGLADDGPWLIQRMRTFIVAATIVFICIMMVSAGAYSDSGLSVLTRYLGTDGLIAVSLYGLERMKLLSASIDGPKSAYKRLYGRGSDCDYNEP